MKLNLLPTYVKQGAVRGRLAAAMVLLFIAVNGLALYWMTTRQAELERLKAEKTEKDQKIQQLVTDSQKADNILAQSKLLLHQAAAVELVQKHNRAYTTLYRGITRFIPDGVRLNQMAISTGDTNDPSAAGGLSAGGSTAAPTLTLQANVRDLKQLGLLLSSLYACPLIASVAMDEVRGPSTQFAKSDSNDQNQTQGFSGAGGNAPSNQFLYVSTNQQGGPGGPGVPGGFPSGQPTSEDQVYIEPLIPGYNTYNFRCVLTTPITPPDVLTILKGSGAPNVLGGGGGDALNGAPQ